MCVVCVTVAGTVVVASQITPIQVLSDFTSSQKTLTSFAGSSSALSAKQRSEIKVLVDGSPEADAVVCTGLTLKGASRSVITTARTRAKASCDYAKRLNPFLETTVVTRTTSSRTNAGRVTVQVRTPKQYESDSGAPIAIPAPSPQVPVEPTSLTDIKNYQQIIYWAWKKSADKINSSSSVVKEAEVLIGPNSGILNKNPLEASQVTSRLFAGFAQPSKIYFISFSYEDSAWAQSKFEELLNDPELLKEIKAPNRGGDKGQTIGICPDPSRCHSSTVKVSRKGVSIVLAGYAPNRTDNVIETQGELQAHEYTHVVQAHQFLGTSRELTGLPSTKSHVPWWMGEGGADFGGFAATYFTSLRGYEVARMRDVYRVPKQTPQWFENFINPPSLEYWIQLEGNGDIYNIGFMIVEIMTAIKGPDAQMEITRQLANGKTMDEAFESVFNMPWKTAVPIIAKLISEERAKFN